MAPDTNCQGHAFMEDLQHGNGKQHVAVMTSMMALAHCCHRQHWCASCTRRVLLNEGWRPRLGSRHQLSPGLSPAEAPRAPAARRRGAGAVAGGRPPATRMAGGASGGQLARISTPRASAHRWYVLSLTASVTALEYLQWQPALLDNVTEILSEAGPARTMNADSWRSSCRSLLIAQTVATPAVMDSTMGCSGNGGHRNGC